MAEQTRVDRYEKALREIAKTCARRTRLADQSDLGQIARAALSVTPPTTKEDR